MANPNAKSRKWALQEHYVRKVKPHLNSAPWLLRITEHRDKPAPVLIIKERIMPNGVETGELGTGPLYRLEDRGLIYGPALRRCLPILKEIVSKVTDPDGVPLEVQRFLVDRGIAFQDNLPLDEESGPKLALIFKLRERVQEMDRVELIARRVARFTREEAAYWFSRITDFGEDPNRWARSGMRTMLGGQHGDPAVQDMLERLRNTY